MNKEKDLEILQFFYNIETLRQNRKKYKDYFDNIDKYEDIHNYLINRFYPQCEDKSSIERIRALYDPRITDEVKYNLEHTPKCPVCGEYIPFKFDRFPRYFNETCNQSCQAKLKYSREMESGNGNFGASKEAKDKIRRTKEENKCNFEFVFSGKQIKVEKYDKMLTDILVLETKDNKERVGERLKNIYHNKKYEKYKNIRYYLNNRFTDSESPNETLLRIKYNVEERPVCPICGGKVKYKGMTGWTLEHSLFDTYCSNRCANKANKEAANETKKILYGSSNNSSKRIETIISIHGENYFSEMMKKIWENKSEEERLEVNEKISKSLKNRSPLEKAATIIQRKETNYLIHGNPNYVNTEQAMKTNIEKHGSIEAYKEYLSNRTRNWYNSLSEKRKQEIKNSIKETQYTLYNGFWNPVVQEKTMIEKYGVKYWAQTDEGKRRLSEIGRDPNIQKAKSETRRKNNTFKSSCVEDEIKVVLQSIFPNLKDHYKNDPRYPFECDFYIPDLDMFIEYNGSQFHNTEPFNPNNIKHLEIIKKYKTRSNELKKEKCKDNTQYDNMIYDWTIRDVNKRETAKRNKLNYIELWNKKEAFDFISTLIENINK